MSHQKSFTSLFESVSACSNMSQSSFVVKCNSTQQYRLYVGIHSNVFGELIYSNY